MVWALYLSLPLSLYLSLCAPRPCCVDGGRLPDEVGVHGVGVIGSRVLFPNHRHQVASISRNLLIAITVNTAIKPEHQSATINQGHNCRRERGTQRIHHYYRKQRN